jgi:hypothetical protein
MIDWSARADCNYAFDYEGIFADIREHKDKLIQEEFIEYKRKTYRSLILNDLYFIVQFVLEIPKANHPFVVQACRDIQEGPKDMTLDIYAREHFKSTIITISETIQHAMANPEDAQGIFSYIAPRAEDFLFSIKQTFEQRAILKFCFPDIVWQKPETEAPKWSLDSGLVLKRKTTRKEASISAHGLVEGLPTGFHFERRVYDDIITEDIADSPYMIETVKRKFDSSQNCGTDFGTHRVVGTPYAHNDPLDYVKRKLIPGDIEEKRLYILREKPATDDGTRTGKPVLLSEDYLNKLRATSTFDCQQLLNPTPADTRKLEGKYLQPIEPKFIPRNVVRFQIVDPAGDDKNKGKSDAWAAAIIAVEPHGDDLGMSKVFIEDMFIEPMREEEAPDRIARQHLSAKGIIQQVGVEKVALSTTEIHVSNALAKYHRYISVKNGSLVILTPAGRDKKKRIERALAWPLYNSKIFYSTAIPSHYIDRLKMEMDFHPKWHDDGMDMLAYLYDMIRDYKYGWNEEWEEDDEQKDNVIQMRETSNITGY